MADIIDQAQDFERINLAQSMQVQRERAQRTPRPTPQGHCLDPECMEAFDGSLAGRIYCGPACAESHGRKLKQHYR